MSGRVKITEGEVDARLAIDGAKRIGEYITARIPIVFECKCGNEHKITWDSLNSISRSNRIARCPECSGQAPPSTDKLDGYFIKWGAEIVGKYIRSTVPIKFICKCGNEHQIRWDCIQQGQPIVCRVCSGMASPSLDRIDKLFEKDGALRIGVYVSNKVPIKFRCRCGNEHKVSWIELDKEGYIARCLECSGLAPPSLERIDKRLAEDGAMRIGEYVNANTPMIFKCKCGNEHHIRWSNLHTGYIARCPDCYDKVRLRGEKNPNYNPNLTDEDRDKHRGLDFIEWRDSVKDSAGWKCIICGSNKNLEAHHLNGWRDFPDERFLLDNGVSLCRDHHNDFHRFMGGKGVKATRDDYDVWRDGR